MFRDFMAMQADPSDPDFSKWDSFLTKRQRVEAADVTEDDGERCGPLPSHADLESLLHRMNVPRILGKVSAHVDTLTRHGCYNPDSDKLDFHLIRTMDAFVEISHLVQTLEEEVAAEEAVEAALHEHPDVHSATARTLQLPERTLCAQVIWKDGTWTDERAERLRSWLSSRVPPEQVPLIVRAFGDEDE